VTTGGWTGSDRVARGAIAAGVLAMLAVAALAPMRQGLTRLVQDDAFYYLEIARRIGLGQGATFDGVNPTNGYHPLWLALLLPLAPLFEADREAGVRVVVAIGVLLLGAALVLLHAAARRIAPRTAALAPLWGVAALTFSSLVGMESPLAACLLAGLLLLATRAPTTLRAGLALGVVAGLLVLARLDSAVYVAALDLVWAVRLLRDRDARGGRAWAACVVAQAALVLPYLAWNLATTGHLLTVSAEVKAGRRGGLNLDWAKSRLAVLGVASAVGGGLAAWTRRGRSMPLALGVAALGTALSLVVDALGGSRETFEWYFTLPVLCGGLFLAVGAEALLDRGLAPRVVGVGVALVLLVVLVGTLNGKRRPSPFVERYDRAVWIAAHAPPDAVFAEPDCGILGYVSRHPFLNTDGLSNSWAFQQAIADDTLPAWFRAAGLDAVAIAADRPPWRAPDGRRLQPLVVRRGLHGEQRTCASVVEPWAGAPEVGAYRLWRIVDVVCGKAAAGVPQPP
jgi:hypothetical protein